MNKSALLKSLREDFSRIYLQLDARTLGFGRIFFGAVLIGDLLRRLPILRDFYTNAGLIPNHTVLWRPPMPRMFSLMLMSSLAEEALLWFGVCFVCFFFFMIGYRTRLFHILSFVMTTSLHNRMLFAENWGGVAIGALMAWTVFLPMGRRFSVDAVRASLRARPDERPEDLAAGVPPPDDRPAKSLAALCLLVQIAIIYWFNFVHKSGPTWHDGTAIYYVLHQERIITWLGLQVREHVPFMVTKALTVATLIIEASIPFLVLSPLFWRWTRGLAILLLFGLHTNIALLVNLGIFSAAMIAYQPFLLTDGHWQLLGRIVPRRGRARTVFYDADCGICFFAVRVLARLDGHHRLRWIANRDAATVIPDADPALLDQTVWVVDPQGNRRWTRGDAFTQIFMALPFGRFWAWPLLLPGFRQLSNWVYGVVARNRTRISLWFGLSGCGLPGLPRNPDQAPPEVTPLRAWVRGRLPVLRELGVAVVLVILAAEVSVANAAVPRWMRFDRRPEWMVAAVMYPHIFQSWSLFSPDAPLSDETVYVDAVTSDGRHVDPYNEAGSRVWSLPVDQVPVRLGHDSFWCDYTLRIPDASQYHQALTEWILRYPERTGNKKDAIVRFEAVVLWQDTPKPGEKTGPTNFRKRTFLQWGAGQP